MRQRKESQKIKSVKSVVGEIRLHHDGYGFVVVDDPKVPDVFIPARYMGYAMHRDTVEVSVSVGRKGGDSLEGRVLNVIKRGLTQMVGRFEHIGRDFFVVSEDMRVQHRVSVPVKGAAHARNGQTVVVEITDYPGPESQLKGNIIKVLGDRGDEAVETEIVIAKHQLPTEFPKNVLEHTQKIVSRFHGRTHEEGRVDLRDRIIFTVDGENAKDFDDAVGVEKCDGGAIRLYVSIADVCFFVENGGPIDKEAYQRGTSVYFPHKCIPMLPPGLSEDLCSLRPAEDRLTVTAEMLIAPDGTVIESKFYRSIIHSKSRLTYTIVRQILADKEEKVIRQYPHLVSHIQLMEELCGRLRAQRIKRGSIDFDLPEPQIVLDMEGSPEDIVRSERNIAHMIIEEFMIAANEAVASYLTQRHYPCLYRIHESPDPKKMHEFELLVHNLGYNVHFGKKIGPGTLAKLVGMAKGRPDERLVNTMLLRSLAQAVYATNNVGHFGLASDCYCHFTSPIRRYPDLVVHRLLLRAIGDKGARAKGGYNADFQAIAEHSSRRERVSVDAEREMLALYTTMFMQDKIGEEYDGIVAHVTKFGFFVELIDFFVEGLVHLNTLDSDDFRFDEKAQALIGAGKKKVYKIGDKVRVKVEEVSIEKREINFELC